MYLQFFSISYIVAVVLPSILVASVAFVKGRSQSITYLALSFLFTVGIYGGFLFASVEYESTGSFHRWVTVTTCAVSYAFLQQFVFRYPTPWLPRLHKPVLVLELAISLTLAAWFASKTLNASQIYYFDGHYWDFKALFEGKVVALVLEIFTLLSLLTLFAQIVRSPGHRLNLLGIFASLMFITFFPLALLISFRMGRITAVSYTTLLSISFTVGCALFILVFLSRDDSGSTLQTRVLSAMVAAFLIAMELMIGLSQEAVESQYNSEHLVLNPTLENAYYAVRHTQTGEHHTLFVRPDTPLPETYRDDIQKGPRNYKIAGTTRVIAFKQIHDDGWIEAGFPYLEYRKFIHNYVFLCVVFLLSSFMMICLGFGYFIKTTLLAPLQFLKLEKQLIESQAAMKANANLAQIGVMAGGVAHEINNPLGALQLSTDSIEAQLQESEPIHSSIAKNLLLIKKSSARIARIVRSLSTIAHNGTHDPFVVVKASTLVRDVASLNEERFKGNQVSFEIEILDEEAEINCRATQISQMLVNLINNAWDAIENQSDKWIRIAVTRVGSSVEVRITDSGKGIDCSVADKIFDPFFTTKEIGKGTGLGLSEAASIIKDNHGTLKLNRDAPNTQFVILLPLAQPSVVSKAG